MGEVHREKAPTGHALVGPPRENTRAEAVAPIKVVTFDLDDTLWDVWSVIERAETHLHRWLEIRHPEITERYDPQGLRELCGEIAIREPDLSHDRTYLRKAALRLAAERSGSQGFSAESAFDVFYAIRNDVEFFEDVLPVLERLTGRYQIGALSNGNANLLMIGIEHFFDFALNPQRVGSPKPQPDMFAEACRISGAEPEEIVHVGDDPELDVEAAARFGFRTVWINRNSRSWSHEILPDAEITSLEELDKLLRAWEGGPGADSPAFESG